MGSRPRLTVDTVCLGLGIKTSPHGVTSGQPHDDPHRGDDAIEQHAQDDAGVDPSQNMADEHPSLVYLLEYARNRDPGGNQNSSQHNCPQPHRVLTTHKRPKSNQQENPTDHQSELAQRPLRNLLMLHFPYLSLKDTTLSFRRIPRHDSLATKIAEPGIENRDIHHDEK